MSDCPHGHVGISDYLSDWERVSTKLAAVEAKLAVVTTSERGLTLERDEARARLVATEALVDKLEARCVELEKSNEESQRPEDIVQLLQRAASKIRNWSEVVLGVPPEDVSGGKLLYEHAAEEIISLRLTKLNDKARCDKLSTALREAMKVRHFCDREVDLDNGDPYKYDKYLQRWAEALGEKVVSNWPKP